MTAVILERGKNYEFLSKFDPRYALRLSNLFGNRFSTLRQLIETVEKMGLDGQRFYVPDKANLGSALRECPVFYQFRMRNIESARIRITD